MEADPDVEHIYLERIAKRQLDFSRSAVGASDVQARGISGRNVRVAIVEEGVIAMHDALQPPDLRIHCVPGGVGLIEQHKTRVAGVIGSRHSKYRGIAPSVQIIDAIAADGSDTAALEALECAVREKAAVVNMSFGFGSSGRLDMIAKSVDEIVYKTGVAIVAAAGNVCGDFVAKFRRSPLTSSQWAHSTTTTP